MSTIDILFRVDTICKKYEKYDIDKQRELNAYGDDAFARLLASFDSQIEAALHVQWHFDALLSLSPCDNIVDGIFAFLEIRKGGDGNK